MHGRSKGGWVLVETLVAMVLLSVGVLSLNRALRESMLTRAIAKDYTTAQFLLEEKMGELEMQPVLNEGDTGSGDFGKAHPRFSCVWSVGKVVMPVPPVPSELQQFFLEPPALPEPELGKISVTIRWTRNDRQYDATAETLIPSKRLRTVEDLNAAATPPA